MKDILIIGAGPIGLACGIEAKKNDLDYLNYTRQVFIVDKQKNQRGRIDDRDEDEIKNDP